MFINFCFGWSISHKGTQLGHTLPLNTETGESSRPSYLSLSDLERSSSQLLIQCLYFTPLSMRHLIFTSHMLLLTTIRKLYVESSYIMRSELDGLWRVKFTVKVKVMDLSNRYISEVNKIRAYGTIDFTKNRKWYMGMPPYYHIWPWMTLRLSSMLLIF